jgi:hypothetical protein
MPAVWMSRSRDRDVFHRSRANLSLESLSGAAGRSHVRALAAAASAARDARGAHPGRPPRRGDAGARERDSPARGADRRKPSPLVGAPGVGSGGEARVARGAVRRAVAPTRGARVHARDDTGRRRARIQGGPRRLSPGQRQRREGLRALRRGRRAEPAPGVGGASGGRDHRLTRGRGRRWRTRALHRERCRG